MVVLTEFPPRNRGSATRKRVTKRMVTKKQPFSGTKEALNCKARFFCGSDIWQKRHGSTNGLDSVSGAALDSQDVPCSQSSFGAESRFLRASCGQFCPPPPRLAPAPLFAHIPSFHPPSPPPAWNLDFICGYSQRVREGHYVVASSGFRGAQTVRRRHD